MPQGVEQCQPNRYAKRTLHCNCLFTELTWLIHCAWLRLPSSGCPPLPFGTSLAGPCHCHPIDNCWQIICHLAAFRFWHFSAAVAIGMCHKFWAQYVVKSLAICRPVCLSVYLSLSSLSSWQFVCHSALSLSLPVYRFFGCLDFATATKNVPATLCIEVFVTLPELLLLLQPMQLAIFHTTSQSVPPFPHDTTPANLQLPPLQSYALLVLVCRRRVPQIAACVRCSKQTNKNQNTNNNNKNNNKWQQQQQQAEPASSKKFNETAVEKAAKA